MLIWAEPTPEGVRIECPVGRPSPTCSMSRTIMSMPMRRVLFMPVVSMAVSLSRIAWLIAMVAEPSTMQVMPVATSSSTIVKPAVSRSLARMADLLSVMRMRKYKW